MSDQATLDARHVCNALAAAEGKRPHDGYSRSARKRARKHAAPILQRWLQDPSALPPVAARYLIHHDDDDWSMINRLGIATAVYLALNAGTSAVNHVAEEASVIDVSVEQENVQQEDNGAQLSDSDGSNGEDMAEDSHTSDGAIETAQDDPGRNERGDSAPEEEEVIEEEHEVHFEEVFKNLMESSEGPSNSGQDTAPQVSFVKLLQDWAVKYRISKNALTGLLVRLLLHKPHVDYTQLPRSGRQLLKVSCYSVLIVQVDVLDGHADQTA